MKPYLRIESTHNNTVTYVNPKPRGSNKRVHIGCLSDTIPKWSRVGIVHQLGFSVGWCVSLWETIPDTLWWARGLKDIFFMCVHIRVLDFRNTAFEHRYNLFSYQDGEPNIRRGGVLETLAEMEKLVWSRGHKEFVPFKRPHPQGYKGVWGDFSDLAELDPYTVTFRAHDKFESGHHTLIKGWV